MISILSLFRAEDFFWYVGDEDGENGSVCLAPIGPPHFSICTHFLDILDFHNILNIYYDFYIYIPLSPFFQEQKEKGTYSVPQYFKRLDNIIKRVDKIKHRLK